MLPGSDCGKGCALLTTGAAKLSALSRISLTAGDVNGQTVSFQNVSQGNPVRLVRRIHGFVTAHKHECMLALDIFMAVALGAGVLFVLISNGAGL